MGSSNVGLCSVFLLLLMVQVAFASEIVIEGDGNPSHLIFMGDAPRGISAFGVEIQYSNGTQVIKVEPVEPFEVVSGTNPVTGVLKIGGYASQDSQLAAYGQVRLAKIWSEQPFEGIITVDYIEDFQRSPIQISNPVHTSPTPTGACIPVYDPPVTYKSPGTVQTDSPHHVEVPEIGVQPSPEHQTPAPETPSPTEILRDTVTTQTISPSTTSPIISPEAGACETPSILPKKTPALLYTPIAAISCAILLIMRRKEKNC